MNNVKNIIKLAAALGAFYLAIQIVNPTGGATANSDAIKYETKFNSAYSYCEKVAGDKVNQIMTHGREVCTEVAHNIVKNESK